MPPVTPAHRRAIDTYNAKCGRMELRPLQDVVDDIRAAAAQAGQSLQKYILLAVRARMRAEGFITKSNNWPEDESIKLKYCYLAQFADGTRHRFYGISETACTDSIAEAVAAHGDVTWYDGATDEYYENGLLYTCQPSPPVLPQIEL